MLDLNFIKQNPEQVKTSVKRRGLNVNVDQLLDLVSRKGKILQKVEQLRAERNVLSKSGQGKAPDVKLINRAKEIKQELKELEPTLNDLGDSVQDLHSQIPNLLSPEVPDGKNDNDNVELRAWGGKPEFKFPAKNHLELGVALDLIDVERASEVSGSGFAFLKNQAAFLEFALVEYATKVLIKKGYTPMVVPEMVRGRCAESTGYLPRGEDPDIYKIEGEDLYLVATAEMPLTGYHTDEILEEKDLPKKYAGFSSCFRKESGAYGKHKKGIFRLHQFDKVEIYQFTTQENSPQAFEEIIAIEEEIFKGLRIPYRVTNICTGDMSAPAFIKYDLEYWSPFDKTYRELTSCSNCTDYQTRRLGIRYRTQKGELKFVYTLNGTACAIGRTLVAILENYQNKDGSVTVPKVLRKYVGEKKIT